LPHCSRSSPKSLQLSFAPTCAQCTVMEQSFASMPAQSYQPKVDCYLPMRSLQGSSMELASSSDNSDNCVCTQGDVYTCWCAGYQNKTDVTYADLLGGSDNVKAAIPKL
jgi:hypothetical protein